MTSITPLVSVVLLSYNRPGYLREALRSLLAQSYENYEIMVVDNPSPSSAEIARIVGQYERVKLLRNSTNLGYAGGMNRGIESVSGHYVFLTEDDIVLEKDCLRHLVAYMNEQPAAGLVAPVIYSVENKTINCAGGEIVLGAVYRKKLYGEGTYDTGQFPRPFEVTYIDGAAILARSDFLKRLKGFREEFFMYVESTELCARVIKAGKTLVVVPQAKVHHFEPPPVGIPPEIEFHKVKNFFSLYLLHAPVRVLPEFICRYALWDTLRSIAMNRGRTRLTLKALLWVLRKTPSLLRERRRGFASHVSTEDDASADKRASLGVVKSRA